MSFWLESLSILLQIIIPYTFACNLLFSKRGCASIGQHASIGTYAVCPNYYLPPVPQARGREILQRPPSVRPSVCPSVTFSFRTLTQKRIAVFSRNFAGTCTKSWGCAVQLLILMECCLNFLGIFLYKFVIYFFFKISCFLRVSCYFQHLKRNLV